MRVDRIRNEFVRRSNSMASIVHKVRKSVPRGFVLVMRREKSEAVRTVMEINVRRKSRPKEMV